MLSVSGQRSLNSRSVTALALGTLSKISSRLPNLTSLFSSAPRFVPVSNAIAARMAMKISTHAYTRTITFDAYLPHSCMKMVDTYNSKYPDVSIYALQKFQFTLMGITIRVISPKGDTLRPFEHMNGSHSQFQKTWNSNKPPRCSAVGLRCFRPLFVMVLGRYSIFWNKMSINVLQRPGKYVGIVGIGGLGYDTTCSLIDERLNGIS